MKTVENQTISSNQPQSIDLGLPSGTKWASCNIGASKPEEYGGYFAWGELNDKQNYDWDTYAYYDKQKNGYFDLGSCICGTQYDIAHEKWGDKWQMPTCDQIKELLNCCTFEWTTLNAVKGAIFTGPNGNSIFLPAAGYYFSYGLEDAEEGGSYWSGTLSPYSDLNAFHLEFFKNSAGWDHCFDRYYGHSIRPVAAL